MKGGENMLLVYDQILSRVHNAVDYKEVYAKDTYKPLIESFDIGNLQSASYDITIGTKIMKFKDTYSTIQLSNKLEVDSLFVEQDITYGYTLRPGEYILMKMNEQLNMPDDLAAHIRPRTTFNKLGLIIMPQHVNPSYCGYLQIGMKNMTPHGIQIEPNLIVGQIVFEQLAGKVKETELYRNKNDSKYQNEDNFVGSKVYDEATRRKVEEIYNGFLEDKNRGE